MREKIKLEQLVQNLLLTSTFAVLISTPAHSEEFQRRDLERSFGLTGTDEISNQFLPLLEKTQPVEPIREIPRLSQVKLPLKSAQKLVQSPTTSPSPANEVVEVTAVKLVPTNKGVEVILETPFGQRLQVAPKKESNSYIVDIKSAQLRLPSGNTFRQENPVAGVNAVTVTNLDVNTIRVTVTGQTGVPTVELFDSNEGLIFSFQPAAPSTQLPQQNQAQQPQSETQPAKPSAGSDEPIELVVTGAQDRYRVPNATSATRTDTPLINIPQSIQVIPERVLKDQQVIDLNEALQNVSGVSSGSVEGRGFQFNIRGFDGAPVLRDGFRLFSPKGNPDTEGQGFAEIANIDRIEVLRGPSSILYGQIEPGGIVNVVTKKPLENPFYEAEVQFGNRGFIRPRFDFSGPLTSNSSLLYRLNGVYQNEDYFRNFKTDITRYFIAPTVTAKIGDRTDLNIQLEYLNDERPYDTGLVAVGKKVANIPYNRNLNEPGDVIKKEFLNVGYNLEHRFSQNWKLRNAFRYISNNDNLSAALNFDFLPAFNETTGVLNRIFAFQDVSINNYSVQTNLEGKFNTGPLKHTLLFGVDLARYDVNQRSLTDFSLLVPINIYNPVYNTVTRPSRSTQRLVQDFGLTVDNLGVYVQDQISLTDNIFLVGGVRYDTVQQKTVNQPSVIFPNGSESSQSDDALSPRIGIIYKPNDNVSLYANYSRSFIPNTGTTVSGSSLSPEKGEGFEVGVKTELLKGKVFASLAYFDVTKQNVSTSDPGNAFFSVATGEQQSRGVELDLTGEILPGWNVIASYSYIDAEVTKDNTIPVGNTLAGVPKHSASLWTTYEIQAGNLQGLGFGIGFNYVGERTGDLANSFDLDSYFLTNAAIFYRRNNWRFGLNVKNLFDVDYITGIPFGRTRQIEPGAPLTVIGSISVQF